MPPSAEVPFQPCPFCGQPMHVLLPACPECGQYTRWNSRLRPAPGFWPPSRSESAAVPARSLSLRERERAGTEPAAAPPRLLLRGPAEGPIVRGRLKPRLTPGQYRLVEALCQAHPHRLSKDQLARRAEVEDPVHMIDRLRRDRDWAVVLDKPGRAHGGYGLHLEPGSGENA